MTQARWWRRSRGCSTSMIIDQIIAAAIRNSRQIAEAALAGPIA